jgi:mannose-1-phosphate guanylyltransferase
MLMRAFILAAGFGTRLKPITDHIPKALVPVCGKPLLERALAFCRAAGITEIGVNSHHFHAKIASYQCASPIPFTLFHEDGIIRGTGGGLYGARDFLALDDLVFVCNADILYGFDLIPLVEAFWESGRIAGLIAVPTTGPGTILFDKESHAFTGTPTNGPHEEGVMQSEFIGAALYRREFLDLLQPDDFSIVPVWKRIAQQGYPVEVLIVENCYWRDVGTPASLAVAHFEAINGRHGLEIPGWLLVEREMKRCYHRDLKAASVDLLGPYSWVELSQLPEGVQVSRSVVLAGSQVEQNSSIDRRLVTSFGEVSIGK